MRPTRLGPAYAIFDDGTNWPRPGSDVEWQARYGTPDVLTLAAFVSAYEALIMLPRRRRDEVIKALRSVWVPATHGDDRGRP